MKKQNDIRHNDIWLIVIFFTVVIILTLIMIGLSYD